MSCSYRQALPSHHGCHILPVPPDLFMVLLDCPLEKKKADQNSVATIGHGPLLFYDWLTLCFLEKNDSCLEDSPHTSCLQRQLGRHEEPLSAPGILVKCHPVKPWGPNFSPAALSVQTQHNGSLKPREKFIFLLQRETVTITALRSCPSLEEAAGQWTYNCRMPAPWFGFPWANLKHHTKYHARLALARPGTLYSSASTQMRSG